jgi:hypothetical protein
VEIGVVLKQHSPSSASYRTRRNTNMTPKWQPLGDEYPGVDVQVAQVGGRARIVGVRVQHDEGVTLQQLQIPIHRLEAGLSERRDAVATPASIRVNASFPEPPTRRELYLRDEYFTKEGRGYPPEMYEQVAALYRWCVESGIRPAPTIAEANDVPETTVRRWIREARRRGVLDPARTPGGMG